MLQFGPRQPLPAGPHAVLTAAERWKPVTLGRFKAARDFEWLMPGEVIAGELLGGSHGAVAYVLENGDGWLFPVSPFAQPPVTRRT